MQTKTFNLTKATGTLTVGRKPKVVALTVHTGELVVSVTRKGRFSNEARFVMAPVGPEYMTATIDGPSGMEALSDMRFQSSEIVTWR